MQIILKGFFLFLVPNCQLHSNPTSPLVLHRTGIGKCAMKIFGMSCQLRDKLFWIVIHRFSLVKAAMNAPRLCKLSKDCLTGNGHGAMVFTKCLKKFLNFPIAKGRKSTCQLVAELAIKKQGGALIL
jgi:hypothetical protein